MVMQMYVRFPMSLRNVEELLFERGIDICHETVPANGVTSFHPHPCRFDQTGAYMRYRLPRACELSMAMLAWLLLAQTDRTFQRVNRPMLLQSCPARK